jgi:hypothetical protein
MPKRLEKAKVACLDMNLQKARMQMGVQVGANRQGRRWPNAPRKPLQTGPGPAAAGGQPLRLWLG